MPGGVIIFVKTTDIVERLCMSDLMVNKVQHLVEPLVKAAITVTISNCSPLILIMIY